jgi:hypothetical protein
MYFKLEPIFLEGNGLKTKMPVSAETNTGILIVGKIKYYALTMQSTGQTDTHCGES